MKCGRWFLNSGNSVSFLFDSIPKSDRIPCNSGSTQFEEFRTGIGCNS